MRSAAECLTAPLREVSSDESLDGALMDDGLSDSVAGRGRVLLVDDDTVLRRSMERLLRAKGYEVVSAEDGIMAHGLLSREKFDVVLSDIAMPALDGIQLLKRLRRVDHQVPVVLITGEPALATAVQALEYGAFHYLTKPVDLATLEEVVEKATQYRRAPHSTDQPAYSTSRSEARNLEALSRNFHHVLDTLWMACQPIVWANTGEVFGYEALLRSEEKSLPHPGAILDAAEQLQLIDQLGRTIRARAAEPMLTRMDNTALFVNLHTTDLLDPELLNPDAPLSRIAHRVVLEVTERSSLEQVGNLHARVNELRKMGFRIAVDDLGAGYAGLTSFALLEPEIVKLDMTLVRDVHQSSTRQKLIRSMTSLCKDMKMLVVGEGVETEEEKAALIDLGCDLLQGYLIAKPGRPFPKVNW